MHIHKFSEMVTFSENAIGGTLPATEEYREFKKNCTRGRFLLPGSPYLSLKSHTAMIPAGEISARENSMCFYGLPMTITI